MYNTGNEIMNQHEALLKTMEWFEKNGQVIKSFFAKNKQRKFFLIGSGSSNMLCKSAASLFSFCEATSSIAVTGGDYLIDPEAYAECIKDAIVIVPSRSGLTSEIVYSVRHIKQKYNAPVLTVTMKEDSDLEKVSDCTVVLPWAYDNSVCQTRTVTNLYTALMLVGALYSDDAALYEDIKKAVFANDKFKLDNKEALCAIAARPWKNVIVLSDNVLSGIGEEGALAFSEICQLPGHHFNLLDYRHGPMVLCGKETLVIMVVRPCETSRQMEMVKDLLAKGCTLVTVSAQKENIFDSALNIEISGLDRLAAWGIPFVFVPQMLAYEKAMLLGVNPDAPQGLDPYILLK